MGAFLSVMLDKFGRGGVWGVLKSTKRRQSRLKLVSIVGLLA